MSSVPDTVQRLRDDQESGALGVLCDELQIDLLLLFGSALDDLSRARDVDVAYSFAHGSDGDEIAVASAFVGRYGEHMDLMPLDRAGAVARFSALSFGEPLVERTPGKHARAQIAAFGQYRDEEPRRRALLEVLAHGAEKAE